MLDAQDQYTDSITRKLRTYVENILIVTFGILPILFVPSKIAPFEYTKVLFVLVGIVTALILFILSTLRSGKLNIHIPYPLYALWALVIVASISTFLSGDLQDSLIGDFFSIHSTAFVLLLAVVPTLFVLVKPSKVAIMKMYALIAMSTLVLVFFHISRILFGEAFLSFDVFNSAASSPVGTWNDLALFLGLVVISSIVALEQLSLSRTGKGLFALVTVLSLGVLGVINFTTVWFVLGLASLTIVIYSLSKDRLSNAQPSLISDKNKSPVSLMVSLGVFVFSVFFVIGGVGIGGWISQFTNINYVEVRPSLEATSNIARQVYTENALLGVGPNKFVDAWRLYKDDSINLTAFWNTDFNAGNAYITTFFVTTGLLGGVAWTLFFLMYLVFGVRKLIAVTIADKLWHFIAISSFVGALYIWFISIVYVPGIVILILGALYTGVSLVAFTVLSDKKEALFEIGDNRNAGFVLTFIVVVVIVGSVTLLHSAIRHYSAVYIFNQTAAAMQQGQDIALLEQDIFRAYNLYASDVFMRRLAEYQLARLNSLVQVTEPTDIQVREFNDIAANGIRFAQESIRLDANEPANWSVLAGMYGLLTSLGVDGAEDRTREALSRIITLNPKNPIPYLELGIIEGRSGNLLLARENIQKAIKLKPNFTEAYYVSAQLAIVQGNVEEAVQSTLSTINLEPSNPVHYYQLGLLEVSRDNTAVAINAFERAIALDRNYANARYLLALALDVEGDSERARAELQYVLNLNPNNTEVAGLIQIIDTEGSLDSVRSSVADIISEPIPAVSDSGVVNTTSSDTQTSLITPVNTSSGETEVEATE